MSHQESQQEPVFTRRGAWLGLIAYCVVVVIVGWIVK